MANVIALLRDCGLSEHAAKELAQGAVLVQLTVGDDLFQAGQSADDYVAFLGPNTMVEVIPHGWVNGTLRTLMIQGGRALPVGYFARFMRSGVRSADVRVVQAGNVVYVAFDTWSNNAECLRLALAAWINGDERHL